MPAYGRNIKRNSSDPMERASSGNRFCPRIAESYMKEPCGPRPQPVREHCTVPRGSHEVVASHSCSSDRLQWFCPREQTCPDGLCAWGNLVCWGRRAGRRTKLRTDRMPMLLRVTLYPTCPSPAVYDCLRPPRQHTDAPHRRSQELPVGQIESRFGCQ